MLKPVFRRKRRSAWKGLAGGLAGGLAATVVMSQFQDVWSKLSRKTSAPKPQTSSPDQKAERETEDATMKAAGKLASLAGYELSHQARKKAGPVIHYGFGTSFGVVYGLARQTGPRALRQVNPALLGAGFGFALFLAADEIAVPAFGLSGKPSEAPLSSHVYGLVSHLVYGVSMGAVDYLARKLL